MSNLDLAERKKIEFYWRGKLGIRAIARKLYRNHTVIGREIQRNRNRQGRYDAIQAQALADGRERRRKKGKYKLAEDIPLHHYVVDHLKEGWSPEQISGRLEHHPPARLAGKHISYESIYRYIYEGQGRWEHLYPYLRKKKPKRYRRCGRKPKKSCIMERISIHDRPEEVNTKQTCGHWESDTVHCKKQRSAISVQYERKSQFVRLHKLTNKSAAETERALIATVESVPGSLCKTMTFDNGSEGACHTTLRHQFDIATFFCDAFSPWQKGGIENSNGLLREYIPRETNLDALTISQLQQIEDRLNNRPRKTNHYLTPNEVLTREGGAFNS